MQQLAVITGSSKGIGRALAFKFASCGFSIVLNARNEKNLTRLANEITTAYPNIRVHFRPTDVSDEKDVKDFAKFIQAINKPVEVLINNAGIFLPGTIHEEAEGNLEQMMNTNLYSAYHLSRALIPGMKKRKDGHIFNVCSTASLGAYTNGGSYSITKFAMLGMSKNLREELKGFNIRVTSVMPGATYTASWEGADIPEERLMKASDVAETIYNAYALSKTSVVEELVMRPQLGDLG